MKKCRLFVSILLIIGLTIIAVFRINNKDNNKELKKITVADATITSLTLMAIMHQIISFNV